MPRPAGRDLTRTERARLCKLHQFANRERYTAEGHRARTELRAEALRLWRSGASMRTLAEALGVGKSRAGQLVADANRQETAA